MTPIIIVGPCSAESEIQLLTTAQQLFDIKDNLPFPIAYFRAGIWKPRSNPNSFKGVGKEALPWLSHIEHKFGFPICVEIASPEHLDLCEKAGIKTVWIGSRTAVNPFIVQELAEAMKGRDFSVMIKNPIAPDLKLWIGDIERFINVGITKIVAIHRGFSVNAESVYRYQPIWEIPIELKVHYPEIPLICDPSHLAGDTKHIAQIAQIALDYGFNGLMIETHNDPQNALSDSQQQLTPSQLNELLNSLSFKSPLSSPTEIVLRKQRTLIENIDTQISELLRMRMNVVDVIAKIKADNNLPVVQPQQWNKVVNTYLNGAESDEEYKTFINNFLNLLHQASISRQIK